VTGSVAPEPLSTAEVAAGGIALATIAVIAFFASQTPQPREPSTPGPSSASTASNQEPAAAASPSAWLLEPRPLQDTGRAQQTPRESPAYAPIPAGAPRAAVEMPVPPVPDAGRNPRNRPDALWIQTRLHELGYFAGNRSGVWGAASRNALRDFKSMNGLPDDDRWDQATEQRLLSERGIHAAATFIGGWAEDIDRCRHRRDRITISSRGAKTDGAECSFRSVKREGARRWYIVAVCSAEGRSWNANVTLKLIAANLNWSGERGTATYVRCLPSGGSGV
jgi:Putative peptidoglycan binding domain